LQHITGVVRDYDWGRTDAIADLLGREAPGHPEAEYWLGTHPGGPATVSDGAAAGRALGDLVQADRVAMLGSRVAARFGDLPFLLKVLAADRPLSIQAHPNLEQATSGFAAEDELGIPVDGPERNYRDVNHKPELICALTRFEAKCGFRSPERTHRLMAGLARRLDGPSRKLVADLADDLSLVVDDGLRLGSVTARLLGLGPGPGAELASAVVAAASSAAAADDELVEEFGPDLAWTARIADAFPGDVGVVVALLLNHVTLEPGQAIFLDAGNLHSYLSGVGVELMASSDNVLRGGLTSKHIDPDELVRILDDRPSSPPVQRPASPVHTFDVPVPEFSLTRIESDPSSTAGPVDIEIERTGPDLILVTDGSVTLTADTGQAVDAHRGQSVFVSADSGRYRLQASAGAATVAWRATAGVR
jgi:mannose-6-phosphate isomerase